MVSPLVAVTKEAEIAPVDIPKLVIAPDVRALLADRASAVKSPVDKLLDVSDPVNAANDPVIGPVEHAALVIRPFDDNPALVITPPATIDPEVISPVDSVADVRPDCACNDTAEIAPEVMAPVNDSDVPVIPPVDKLPVFASPRAVSPPLTDKDAPVIAPIR